MTRNKRECLARLLGRGTVIHFLGFLLLIADGARAAAPGGEADEPWLRPYTGPTRTDIDATTLDGKVLCGYQGWFNTPGDGTNFGFGHWGQGLNRPGGGRFVVDMWPDISDYDPQDLCEVPGLENARRLAGPALQRLPQGTGAAALQVDAAVWDRRRFPEPLRLSRRPVPRALATSTPFWPACARGVTARDGSGR